MFLFSFMKSSKEVAKGQPSPSPSEKEAKFLHALANRAITADERGQVDTAIDLYVELIERMLVQVRGHEQLVLRRRIEGYVKRAEELKVAAAPPSAAPPAVKSKAQTQSKARTANAALAHVVLDEVLDASPNVQWKDIAGLDDAKQMLQVGIPFTTILYDYSALGSDRIATPPTRSVHWFVRRSQRCATLWASWNSVTASTLTSKWVGEGEKLVRALFDMARELQPSVIFIDEIDSLLSTRSAGEHDASRRLKNEVRSTLLNANPVYYWYSGSDIMNLCKEAAMGPLRSLGDRLKQARAQDIRPISKADFTDALARVSPSVSADTLRRLTEWNARYGLQNAT
ncbi:hypothetical protein DYB25_003742 [Aphanomyces astaci]|uniref:MIT domain-containing protein n=2 Tax=Aphanomyces astaci TaxID=112090 RepID=A0A397BTT8_APHAT|nr:hypothetical protein DYB25_003742 [Aphanomyces astaci]RHY88738.1 hypothetical protein DYB26_002576 [Aphanomyces astaci]